MRSRCPYQYEGTQDEGCQNQSSQASESDVPGDVQGLTNVPHRALSRVRHGRDEHVRSGAGRERRAEDGLRGECEERGDGGELGEHGY